MNQRDNRVISRKDHDWKSLAFFSFPNQCQLIKSHIMKMSNEVNNSLEESQLTHWP